VVLKVATSLDGYIARPDGAFDFLFQPKDYSFAAFYATIDTVVMGRKTYDVARKGMSMFGPSVALYVFSRSEAPGERDGVVFVDQRPAALIARLRKKRGKNIWLMGGGELTREFLKADLVDEIHLGIVPVLIGEGLPLFPPGYPQREFKLVENKTYSQGLIALKYTRVRAKARR
jgi:dihydrofolate reductase